MPGRIRLPSIPYPPCLRRSWVVLTLLAVFLGMSGCVFQTDSQAPQTILFLGNSITRMDSLPDRGWFHQFGMAATSEDSDYVHVTLRQLNSQGLKVEAVLGDRDCLICEGPIDAHAENARKLVDTYQPLAVVVQLGENSSDIAVEAGQLTTQYSRLLNELSAAGAKRIYALSVWNDTSLTASRTFAVQRAVRDFPGIHFLDFTDLAKDSANYGDPAVYADAAVLWHPGNTGMRRIGERLALAIAGDL